ncbi:hypothetical protein OAG1_17740 [Agarivorans sp. OAG1]|uniref:hypothetical protein n=1 Tax=Agarivorans sp. OAG1 TaxID=3082387 RepID=UPI002B2FCDAB|nr:hypothetical protein OAG1_17740 [Agarivorans sp. OAG1]
MTRNNHSWRNNQNRRGPSLENENIAGKRSVCLLSVNGKLKSPYKSVPVSEGGETERASDYKNIEIGKPLVVRYLRHFLYYPDGKNKNNEQIMISSFVKTIEEKKPAAEAITYYNPATSFNDDRLVIESFGADTFGHELIYYTKSYTGQPVRLTTKVMELDNYDDVFDAIKSGTDSLGGLPFFMEYVPYMAAAKSTANFISKLWKLFDKDDPIIPRLALNLFYNRPNHPRLQSGRIICIDSSSKKAQAFIDEGYNLSIDNILKDKDGNAYESSSYFVVQVNSEKHDEYENFEYYQNAAELLAMTNRSKDMSDFINTAVAGFESYADLATIEQMESMQDDLEDEEVLAKFKALFKGMSSDVKSLYRNKYKDILEKNT